MVPLNAVEVEQDHILGRKTLPNMFVYKADEKSNDILPYLFSIEMKCKPII